MAEVYIWQHQDSLRFSLLSLAGSSNIHSSFYSDTRLVWGLEALEVFGVVIILLRALEVTIENR